MRMDTYALHRALFYAGYGKPELYEDGRSRHNIVLVYGGESILPPKLRHNGKAQCDWSHLKSNPTNQPDSIFTDTRLNVNYDCQTATSAGAGVGFNEMSGHVSSPSYFFGHFFDHLSEHDTEIIFKREADNDSTRTHCMYK
tara:strand:+ start:53 stop:475 length:423 start_codon:yes stop_codon:yes gene_type:complete